jgi:hypothetical protein
MAVLFGAAPQSFRGWSTIAAMELITNKGGTPR